MLQKSLLNNTAGAYAVKIPILLHCWGICFENSYQITLLEHTLNFCLSINIVWTNQAHVGCENTLGNRF